MYYTVLTSYAKKHYPNVQVCSLDRLDNRYAFICNSMLISLNKLAIEQNDIIVINRLTFEDNGTPIFSITSPFDIDINLLTAYDVLYQSVSF